MNGMNYAGLDIHKKSISCCVRQADGTIIQEGTITATRQALFQLRVPVTSTLRREIQDVPDRTHQIYAALFDLRRHPWMRRVEMVNGAVAIPGEDRNRGILIALPVFASKIVFERAISGA